MGAPAPWLTRAAALIAELASGASEFQRRRGVGLAALFSCMQTC